MISLECKEILLKFLVSLITTPSNLVSDIRVLEPAPNMNIFSLFSIFLRNLINSFKLSAL